MIKQIGKHIFQTITVLFFLIIIYSLLMIFIFTLPEASVKSNVANSQPYFDVEGNYPTFYTFSPAGQLDNYTDRLMLSKAIKLEGAKNNVDAAFSVAGYARYWHGYLIYLKPLLMFFDILKIRVIISLLHILLLCFTFYKIQSRLGWRISVPFIISWICSYSIFATQSLQFSSSYLTYLIASLVLLKFYSCNKPPKTIFYYFLIVGSFINFIDFLTFPIVTLCVPLILVMLIHFKENQASILTQIKILILGGFGWFIGYAFTWISKWVLGSIILKADVIKAATDQILLRTNGSESQPINRMAVVEINGGLMLVLSNFIFSLIPWVILLVAILLFKQWKATLNLLPIVPLLVLPYIWFQILCSHSTVHAFFTYRSQIGTLFGILCIFAIILFPTKETVITLKERLPFKKKSI